MAVRLHLASLVEDWRRLGRERAVVSHRGNRAFATTYAEMADMAGRFAAELARLGVRPGDRVLIWGENGPEWIAAFFGCLLGGVLAVPLDATGSVAFAQRVIAEVAPKLLVGNRSLLDDLTCESPKVASIAFEDLLQRLPAQANFDVDSYVTAEAPFQIIFTSGTTSEPKGIVHTHRNVLASLGTIEAEINKHRRLARPFHPLRFLHTLPFSHVFGQFMGFWIPPLLGAELHLPAAADPARLVAITKRERVSVLVAVPRVLELLRAHLLTRFPELAPQMEASHGFRAWKRWWRFRRVHSMFGFKFWALICGGATLPADLEAFWNGLGLALIQGYGMTETAALVTLNHPFRVGEGTLGKALPGREVRLSPEGEILVRGDMLAAGTWQNGQYSARAGEWLATGDLAAQDATGELRFLGRKGDVIVTAAGLNIYPQDIEAALLAQPGVRACAVVPCEGPLGPEPVAVLLIDGTEATLNTVSRAANERLADFQQIRRVLQWPEPSFPYTATGKLRRRVIADWSDAQVRGTLSTGREENSADALLALVAEITREPVQGGDAQRLTEDLRLDSLGRVQLQSVIESRFCIEVSDAQMERLETLGQLRALLNAYGTGGEIAGTPQPGAAHSHFGEGSFDALVPASRPVQYAHWPWRWPMQILRSVFLELIAAPLVRLLADPKIRVEAPLRDAGPVLIVANHVNTYDVPLILRALPGGLRRHTAVAMSAELLDNMRRGRGEGNVLVRLLMRPAYWLLLALFNIFPLPQSSGFRQSFAHAGEALDRGYSVLVFPEGRRSWTGHLQPFRPGIGLLVQASLVPVVPLALRGVGNALGRKQPWFRSGRVSIRVGSPIRFAAELSPEEITRQLEAAVRALDPG